ncbi:MAG: SteA domain-containing protein, partial [Actinomycetes bacterium]
GRRLEGAERVAPDQVPEGLSGTDLAIVLGVTCRARLVVVAGSPASFDELLDREREAAAALLAVRLRGGEQVVDAPAVATLHTPGVALWPVLLLLVAGVAALVAALLAVPGGDELLHRLREALPW